MEETPTGLEAFSVGYFSFHPLFRGLVAGLGTFVAVEMAKPGFAYQQIGSQFFARPFGKENAATPKGNPTAVIHGTELPWWLPPSLAFIIFGFII